MSQQAAETTTHFAPAERDLPHAVQQQAAFFQQLPLLQHLIDAMPDAFMILNERRQIIYANQTLFEMLNNPPLSSLLGQRPGEALDCAHAKDSPYGCGTTEFCRTCGAVRAILASLSGRKSVQECRIIQASGAALDLQVWGTPLTVADKPYSIFAIKDISSEKRRRALERIFFHDILNTAGLVLGFGELLKGATDDEAQHLQSQLQRASERLVEEIEAQRQLAAAENNELTLRYDVVQTLDFLRELIAFYTAHEVARGRQIVLDAAAEGITFTSDHTLLRRVIGNMLKNALEAIPAGQTVTLSCGADVESVWFSVHNQAYMPRSVQLQVFQRSFSTKGSDRGLGTYSMKLLSERYLRGVIWFDTSPDVGTTFYARYPRSLGSELAHVTPFSGEPD